MNAMYLLCRENIYSPLVEGQVISNLIEMTRHKNVNIFFVWIKRIDYCFRHQKKIKQVVSRLEKNGITVIQIPVIIGKFPLSKLMFGILKKQVLIQLKKVIEQNKISIIHTRGYNSGLLGAYLKNEIGVKHIFDPRSPYLSEIKSTYSVKESSEKYSFWEKAEKKIVSEADATIGISEAFCSYLKGISSRVFFIPNNVDMEEGNATYFRIDSQKRKSICYVGSLGYGWNDVRVYVKLMKQILSLDAAIKFEFYVVAQCIEQVRLEFERNDIPTDVYSLKTLPRTEILKTIAGCMAGLQIMSTKDCRLGVKTVDYLGAGVPIICNDNAEGAAQIIQQYGVGWNIDHQELSLIIKEAEAFQLNKKCVDFAFKNYSTEATSQKYIDVYSKIGL